MRTRKPAQAVVIRPWDDERLADMAKTIAEYLPNTRRQRSSTSGARMAACSGTLSHLGVPATCTVSIPRRAARQRQAP